MHSFSRVLGKIMMITFIRFGFILLLIRLHNVNINMKEVGNAFSPRSLDLFCHRIFSDTFSLPFLFLSSLLFGECHDLA